MSNTQIATKISPESCGKLEPALHSIEYAMLDDIETMSIDDIENYIHLLQQREQYEFFLAA